MILDDVCWGQMTRARKICEDFLVKLRKRLVSLGGLTKLYKLGITKAVIINYLNFLSKNTPVEVCWSKLVKWIFVSIFKRMYVFA